MKFTIDFKIPKRPLLVEWPSFFTMGSCFAEVQAQKLSNSGFEVLNNPFGIIFNPVSTFKIIERIAQDVEYQTKDFLQYDGAYFCLEHHGNFKFESLQEAISSSNNVLHKTKEFLKNTDVVVLTWGTSLVYIHEESQDVAGNCHKLPQNIFSKKQLSYQDTSRAIASQFHLLRDICKKDVKIIATISPIRHLRSGLIENNRSKAILLAALHEIIESKDDVIYFPSYEIFMDELRDYRFSKEDMTHPTSQAENYIWQRFCETFFGKDLLGIIDQVQSYCTFAAHIPRKNPKTHETLRLEKKKLLLEKYPFLKIE